MFKKVLKNQKGLTLIELLAVIVILGIIAAIAVPAIGNVINNTKLDAVKADALQVLESSNLALASQGVPDDASFDFSKSEAADGTTTTVNDLEAFINDETSLTSYSVKIVDGKVETINFVASVNGTEYTANGITKKDLQLEDFFETTNDDRIGTVTKK
ncbi:prepilin-type N-terminal cleavage/methylation domain-containing protein [Fredinandcohnia onubensis]|uniref:prepilin-type N-terminal cleavage/methylation domain-containing protein n=1 Tax=Fredinandcohnia onubensis TaxID=1571209 RepID=UPI000C0C031E|nr:prepilin-type N-terminal cleavage/methylation domain-containing protein [Fredinandcohnia onubensis]